MLNNRAELPESVVISGHDRWWPLTITYYPFFPFVSVWTMVCWLTEKSGVVPNWCFHLRKEVRARVSLRWIVSSGHRDTGCMICFNFLIRCNSFETVIPRKCVSQQIRSYLHIAKGKDYSKSKKSKSKGT